MLAKSRPASLRQVTPQSSVTPCPPRKAFSTFVRQKHCLRARVKTQGNADNGQMSKREKRGGRWVTAYLGVVDLGTTEHVVPCSLHTSGPGLGREATEALYPILLGYHKTPPPTPTEADRCLFIARFLFHTFEASAQTTGPGDPWDITLHLDLEPKTNHRPPHPSQRSQFPDQNITRSTSICITSLFTRFLE